MASSYAVQVSTDGNEITARNARGGVVTIGTGGDEQFNPVELLLAALGGCAAIDVSTTSRKRRHDVGPFEIEVSGDRAEDARLERITVTYKLADEFPADDPEVRTAVRLTKEVLCTVSRTLEHGAPVDHVVAGAGERS